VDLLNVLNWLFASDSQLQTQMGCRTTHTPLLWSSKVIPHCLSCICNLCNI